MHEPLGMSTVTEVIEKLQQRHVREFIFSSKGLGFDEQHYYQPGDLQIVKAYRFEGNSDPSDESVIYVIQTSDGKLGYTLDAYGTYDNKQPDFDNFLRLVPEKGHDEQLPFTL